MLKPPYRCRYSAVLAWLCLLLLLGAGSLSAQPLMFMIANEPGSSLRNIIVLDSATLDEVARLTTGPDFRPFALDANPQATKVYVSSALDNTVVVIDAETLQFVQSVPFPGESGYLHVSPSGHAVYVLDRAGRRLMALDPDTLEVAQQVQDDDFRILTDFAVSPDGRRLYLNTRAGAESSLLIVDAATFEVTHRLGPPGVTGGGELLPSADGRFLYRVSDRRVYKLDLATFEQEVLAGDDFNARIGGEALDSNAQRLYVLHREGDLLRVYDTETDSIVTERSLTFIDRRTIRVHPETGHLFMGAATSSHLDIYDPVEEQSVAVLTGDWITPRPQLFLVADDDPPPPPTLVTAIEVPVLDPRGALLLVLMLAGCATAVLRSQR